MANTMQFDLVSPERSLASFQATSVQIPGADGDMTAMADHAPTITTLRPGILTVEGPDGSSQFAVTGGCAEITGDGASILAEKAMPVPEVTGADMDALISLASDEAANATPEAKDAANKTLADLEALRATLNV